MEARDERRLVVPLEAALVFVVRLFVVVGRVVAQELHVGVVVVVGRVAPDDGGRREVPGALLKVCNSGVRYSGAPRRGVLLLRS